MNLSRIFEGKVVTENLNNWIDLIFGENQKAKEPDKIKNLFRPESYIDNPENTDKKIIKDRESEEFLLNSVEFGLIPLQTLLKTSKKNFDDKNFFNFDEQKFTTVQTTLLEENLFGKKFKNKKEENFYKKYFNIKITCYEMINYYKSYFLCGNLIGDIHIFERNDEDILKENYIYFKHILTKHDCNSKINCIKFNYNLNLIISGSKEGIINIYTNINFKLIHSVNINKEINFCCLVSNPISSIVYYCENNKILASFPINNNNEYKFNEIKNIKIYFPTLFKDSCDEEILICVDESKKNVVVYSLPELNKFKKSYKCEFEINKIVTYGKKFLFCCGKKTIEQNVIENLEI
jgi:WD40 repeat protein